MVWATSLAVALGQAGQLRSAHAQDPATASGADVMFLVDQSGSMGGRATGSVKDHPDPNDPLGLRFEAPQDLVGLLAEDPLQYRPGSVHRIALINFGSWAVPKLNWTTIAPKSLEELRAQVATLSGPGGDLDAGEFRTSNLGNTNFQAAFTAAKQFFDKLSVSKNRVRAIILLTDGQPCVAPTIPTPVPNQPASANPTPIPDCLNPYQHMQELKQQLAQQFPLGQYHIYVVAMNDSRDDYWKNMAPLWESIPGIVAKKVASNAEVGLFFHNLWWDDLSKTLPTPGGTVIAKPVTPGPIVVPPYLDTISFTFFKKLPEDRLEVRDSTNLLLKPGGKVSESGTNIYKLTVLQPLPGLWRISTTGSTADVKIEMQAYVAKGQLNSPKGPQVQYVPMTVEWQLLDSAGNPLPEYADARYRLSPAIKIKADSEVIPVTLDFKGNSSYAATFTPTRAGLHTIEMEAVSKDLDNKDIVVFKGTVGTFSVGAVTLKAINLPAVSPAFVPLQLSYELQDPSGQPVGVKAGVTVSATLQSATRSFPLMLQNLPDGRFRGEFVPIEPGSHQIRIGATIADPLTGQTRSLSEGAGGTFTAAAPIITLKSPAGAQPQHLPMTISYLVVDSQGNEVKWAPGYQMVFTATMTTAGRAAAQLGLSPSDPTLFSASFTPDQQGSYDLAAFAGVQGPDGRNYPVFTHRAQVPVIPTTIVRLNLVHPGPKEVQQYVRKLALNPAGFFSASNPLAVEAQFVDEANKPLDPRAFLSAGTSTPLRLSVVNNDNKKDYSDKFTLGPTGVPGIYRAEGEGLSVGSYTVKVTTASGLMTQPAYVIPEAARTVQGVVKLVENPFWIALIVLMAAAVVGTAGGLLIRRQINIQLSQHPAHGTIVVENQSGQPLPSGTRTFSGRNHVVLKGFHPSSHIKTMEIRCLSEAESKRGSVKVTVALTTGLRIRGDLVTGGGKLQLGRYQVFVRKIS